MSAALTCAEALELAADLSRHLVRSSGTVALAYVRGERIVFDLAEPQPRRTPHSLCWPVRTREEVLAHWAGYTSAGASEEVR